LGQIRVHTAYINSRACGAFLAGQKLCQKHCETCSSADSEPLEHRNMYRFV
jgi:hypothetical protein